MVIAVLVFAAFANPYAKAESMIFETICAAENSSETLISSYELNGLVDFFNQLEQIYTDQPLAESERIQTALRGAHQNHQEQLSKLTRAIDLKSKLSQAERESIGQTLNSFLKDYEEGKQEVEIGLTEGTEKDRFLQREGLLKALKEGLVSLHSVSLAENLKSITSWGPKEKTEFASLIFEVLPSGFHYQWPAEANEFTANLSRINNQHLNMRSIGRLTGESRFLLAPEVNSMTPGWKVSIAMRDESSPVNNANVELVRSPFHDSLIVRACAAPPNLQNCLPVEISEYCGN